MALAKSWDKRKARYDVVIVGSGYGGAITAARLSNPALTPRQSVCILERGREWPIGSFPDALDKVTSQFRHALTNPLGLYELLAFPDISVIQGSGLGGTSLINANVAIVPDEEAFDRVRWPQSISRQLLHPYYETAKQMLGVNPHPRAKELLKVQALQRRATQIGNQAFGLDIAVNFTDYPNKKNPHGVEQLSCIDCGDCVTGCNVGAKNTLYMNYLPIAHKNGSDIFTQTQVDWVEKIAGGGWRVHGRRYGKQELPEKFQMEAGKIVLAAGALGTTEILLRSEVHGLKLSPKVGTGFTGNGDFFGIAYNSDHQTNVLGFGNNPKHKWRKKNAPGPTIVGAIKYDGNLPFENRITIEDLSFPKAYVSALLLALGVIAGEDTDAGDTSAELMRQLLNNPLNPYVEHNALNHSMLYLVMGKDDAKGTVHLKTSPFDPHGHISIDWDNAGRQLLFTRINEELRRHAQALGAHFIANPFWHLTSRRSLITAHPLGGCPMGDDYLHGAIDEFGRLFANDGSIHEGLFVADGSLIPSALGVNPFLTISALCERIAEKMVKNIGGQAYPDRPEKIAVPGLDAKEVWRYKEADLERIFGRIETKSIDIMVNSGDRVVDIKNDRIRNDKVWKGFFPQGHILNELSTAFYTGFKKRFTRSHNAIVGVTSDADERINVKNSLEEIVLEKKTGTLEKGRYILLRYTEAPWSAYYDIFKVVNDDLLIGRVYLGQFPNGIRLFTFPMVRSYSLDNLTADDHRALYKDAPVPTKEQLDGLWEMRAVANANLSGTLAYLKFDHKPDGRLEARYRFLGLLEGIVEPVFAPDHFQLNDFTPFHDEIRFIDKDLLMGRYTTAAPPVLKGLLADRSLGLLHEDTSSGGTPQFSFYYTLRRSQLQDLPATGYLQNLLNIRLPNGVGLRFDEGMEGYFFPGLTLPEGRDGDRALEKHLPKKGTPAGAIGCNFRVRIKIRDLNEFFENGEHEARLKGSIHFADFLGRGPSTFEIDRRKSGFNYLRINPLTEEAEMLYRIYFTDSENVEYLFLGRKYLEKGTQRGALGVAEALYDYTTLYARLTRVSTGAALGSAYLKFRTFEDFDALQSLTAFLTSFKATGTDNPILQAQAQLRFLAFTNQFVMREYDPLNTMGVMLADEVREMVVRELTRPEPFAALNTIELQAVLRDSSTRPLKELLNTGTVKIDFESRRIHRDSFWKGNFAKDSLLGAANTLFNSLTARDKSAIERYLGGEFWKRFDLIRDNQAIGYVVNYELHYLPGKPVVKQVRYPDSNRKYFQEGDEVLLLTYTNDPYKMIYDVIKIVDDNNAIGVMHWGEFPSGIELATFKMIRHNYPFEHMSVPDHQAIFRHAKVKLPKPAEIVGNWQGHLIFLTRPDISLLNRFHQIAFNLQISQQAQTLDYRYKFGLVAQDAALSLSPEFQRSTNVNALADEIRLIDANTLIGQWAVSDEPWLQPSELRDKLQGFLAAEPERLTIYYLLTRV